MAAWPPRMLIKVHVDTLELKPFPAPPGSDQLILMGGRCSRSKVNVISVQTTSERSADKQQWRLERRPLTPEPDVIRLFMTGPSTGRFLRFNVLLQNCSFS